MNILAAMGAYCFFSTKPHVNFDYEISPSDGQLVIGNKITFWKFLIGDHFMVTFWRLETHMVYCLWKYYPELTYQAIS